MVQADLETLTQVKICSKPEMSGGKLCFQISSSEGESTVYIGAYHRHRLVDQVKKLQDKTVDIEVNRVPWIIRRRYQTMTGISLYLMDIKEG